MSTSTIQSRASPTAALIPGLRQLTRLIKRLIAWMVWEWTIRRGIDALMALDDRALADVGLTRGAVEHLVRYGRPPMRPAEHSAEASPAACEMPRRGDRSARLGRQAPNSGISIRRWSGG